MSVSDTWSNLFFSDRGYFSARQRESVWPDKCHVIICHSLGLHLVPTSLFSDCQVLVLMSCFHSFHGETEKETKRSKKHICSMLQELESNPKSLLGKFHKNCGSSFLLPEEKSMNKRLLIDDLQFLDTNIFDLKSIEHIPQVLVLHGEKDRIVPVQRSKQIKAQLKNSSYVEIKNTGHAFPFTHPEMCWPLINQIITAAI